MTTTAEQITARLTAEALSRMDDTHWKPKYRAAGTAPPAVQSDAWRDRAEECRQWNAVMEREIQHRTPPITFRAPPDAPACRGCDGARFVRYAVAVDSPDFGGAHPCPRCNIAAPLSTTTPPPVKPANWNALPTAAKRAWYDLWNAWNRDQKGGG